MSAPITPDTASREERDKYARAEALFAAGDADSGMPLLLDLVEHNTSMWEPYNDLGVLTLQGGDLKLALHMLRLAAEREPAPAAATSNLSRALLANGRFAEAIDLWVGVLAKEPAATQMRDLSLLLSFAESQPELIATLFDRLKNEWLTQADPSLTPTQYQRVPYGTQLMPVVTLGSLPGSVQIMPPEAEPPRQASFHFSPPPLPDCAPFPEIRQYRIEHAYVRPASDTICLKDRVLVADYTDLTEHLLYDTGTGFFVPFPRHGFGTIRRERVVGHLERGIVLTAWATVNWAHFLSEVLPHVVMAETCGLPADIPLIVSADLHPNVRSMIDRIKAPARPVVAITGNTCIRNATLFGPVTTVPYDYCASVVKFAPPVAPGDCLFSRTALSQTRAAVMSRFDITDSARKRLFIDRKSGGRRVVNRVEVAEFFAGLGFTIVEPEKLGVAEQIKLFADAALIVGQSGAGLANMLFSQPGTRIVVLTLDSPFTIFSYFTNMASALGHELHYLGFPPLPHSVSHPGHADMEVDIAALRQHAHLFELPARG